MLVVAEELVVALAVVVKVLAFAAGYSHCLDHCSDHCYWEARCDLVRPNLSVQF